MMQGSWFTADMLVIPLRNYDLVLGVQWLETLNDIMWNFKQLTMKFKVGTQDFELKGAKSQGVTLCSMEKLTTMLQREGTVVQAQLFSIQNSADVHCAYQPNIGEVCHNGDLDKLLQEFEDIFEVPKGLPPPRSLDHKIVLKDEKINLNLKPYRYPSAQKDVIEAMTQELLDSGVIRPSTSSFAAPVVLVKKKDATWRMCVDYRRLNDATVKDVFPIPLIEELLEELHGAVVFSKLDLRSGYHQVRMYEPDIHKTAFKTHQGHYEFLVLPFGLTNAPATFQSLMNTIFKPVTSFQQHLKDLRMVLSLTRTHTLKAKKSKCMFAGFRVEYLGHIITAAGVATDPQKIVSIQQWPTPTNVKQLRGFLGLAGYYRRFIKGFGVLAKPLTDLLKKEGFHWDEHTQAAFDTFKQVLSNPPVLALPDFSKTFVVETDASAKGLGAVLMQEGHPLAFISKALSTKQQSLSVYDKELLAILMAIKQWHHYLIMKHFIIKTDQQSLKHLLEQKIVTPLQ
ncbi:putative nucleotidyltransferase, Ribonuclease H [Helianthus annuus]|nr:putative nucleotidyltransferase, Ribonuclease H [Helianthus annuus]